MEQLEQLEPITGARKRRSAHSSTASLSTRSSRFELNYRPLLTRAGLRNRTPLNLPNWWAPSTIDSFDFSPDYDPQARELSQIQSTNEPWKPAFYQRPPDGDWLYWALVAGRGTGKTDAGAHYVDDYMRQHPGHRVAIIAPTLGDARATCVEGETGLLAANPSVHFNRSWGELIWPNGAHGQLFGAYSPDDVERLRGPQFHLVWCEEFAAWRQIFQAWDMMRLGLRLGPRPHAIITTTPKPRAKLVEILNDSATVIARTEDGRIPTTNDNPHLHPSVRAELYRQYGGTRLGRQELGGEILADVEGALFRRDQIDMFRAARAPQQQRIVVGVDPSGGGNAQGVVIAGVGVDGRGYVFEDRTVTATPEGWGRVVVNAYHAYRANYVIAEVNYGGDMVTHVINTIDPRVPVKVVHASRGKAQRAEPVAALMSQGKISHVGRGLEKLEDELCTWEPGQSKWSPNRLDAYVWAFTELMVEGGQPFATAVAGSRPMVERYRPR